MASLWISNLTFARQGQRITASATVRDANGPVSGVY